MTFFQRGRAISELHGDLYRGGVAYSARFPSRAALVETALGQPLIEAHTQRNAAIDGVQMMLGKDKLPEAGAEAHDAYDAGAQNDVREHGVNVSARVDIEQNLVGPYDWDRLVLPRWPSFAVFTDLRLKPGYVEAQRFRVDSAAMYGHYITIAR